MDDLQNKILENEATNSGYFSFVSEVFRHFKRQGLGKWILIGGDNAMVDHVYLPKLAATTEKHGYKVECGYRMSGVVLALFKA